MDNGLRQTVQHLLRPTDTCVHAVQGKLLGVLDLAVRLCAVVKHETREEYALFIFSVDQLEQPPCCGVEAIYPIRPPFTAHTQVIKDGWSQVLVVTGDGSTLLLELKATQYPQVFIAQLNKATQLFSQSASRDSVAAFDWLLGYEACHTGWDRFSKPVHPPKTSSSSTNPFVDFGEGSISEGPAMQAALPEKWPWSHIITPNSDGSTDIATCEDDLSQFDPLCTKNGREDTETVGITVTEHSPSPAADTPPQNPFVSLSSNPFSSSLQAHPPTAHPPTAHSVAHRGGGIRSCISESNLPCLETETLQHTRLRGEPLITRSTENLMSIDEVNRHCVAGSADSVEFKTGGGSASSLSDVGQENGHLQENGDSSATESQPRKGGRKRREKEERRTVATDQRYSKFDVITDNEVRAVTGRRRLNHSPDLRDLHKPRDAIKMRFKRPTGSQTVASKVNMSQPELTSGQLPKSRSRAETRARSSSQWVSRYRPGVPVAMSNARESFVQVELRQREREFCNKKTLRVFCGSWNVNGKAPPSTLDQFLLEYEGHSDGSKPRTPDIYAIGFQELDLSAQALMGVESSREEAWIRAVEETLSKAGSYHKLLHLRLVGIMILIYITQPLLASVSDKDVEYVTTGIGGVLGNKGGVGARFNLFHSSFCFVNCHFAASMEEVDKRNQDYHTISNKMVFDKCQDYKYNVMEHDIVFWLGDMNYRIQTSAEMTVEMIKAHADNYQISTLLREDQLVQEMTKGTVFSDFAEGSIDFKPTYKYDPNTDNWDTSDKHRAPAWCDRVLYSGMGAELRAYRSHSKMKISDHKPVSAVFDCNVRVVDPVREKNVLEDITRKLDKMENDTLPQVDLSQREFVFSNVKFQVPQSQTLMVTNAGGRPVLVSFIPKLDEESYCKPWINAKPSSAVLQPLQDVAIVLTVSVDCDTASSLTSGQNVIDDILVLHLEGGKDFFISVSGNYLPSCFGASLETLVHLHTYIREVPTADLIDLSLSSSWDCCNRTKPPSSSSSSSPHSSRDPSPSSRHTVPPHDIPKELFQMVTFLDAHALKQENLFRERGLEAEMQLIRDTLDVGGSRELPGSTHSVANCLLIFLSALSEPVIPVPLHQRAVDCCNQPMLCKQLLLSLSRVHQRTFTFIISFMKRLLSHSEDNGLDAKLLATVFGDILLRTPAKERRTRSKKQLGPLGRKKATFVYQFLVTDLTADYR